MVNYSSELLQDVPPGWIHRGRKSGIDPLDGKAHPARKVHYPEGQCQACGNDLVIKSGRGRKPKYCPDCAPKVADAGRRDSRNRARNLRNQVGVVPFRKLPFAQYVRYFNYGVPGAQRIFWQDSDFSEASIHVSEAKGFTSEWYFAEQGTGYFRPVIARASHAWNSVKARKQGSDCLHFIHEDSEALPKGKEPERVGLTHCDECGGELELIQASGRNVGAKIGSKVVACKSCGLVAIGAGVRSYPDSGASNDYHGVA